MSGLADTLALAGFRAGWAVVRRLPARTAYRVFDLAADRAVARGGRDVQRLRGNYARVRPELDDAALDALVRAGMRSYMRYFCEAFRLPAMSTAEVDASVRIVGDGPLRDHLAAGRSVVCFLGHMGNWDLAGAWGRRHLGPVVTVAERLRPEELFTEFVEFRERLGLTILPLTGGGDPFAELARHLAGDEPVVMPLLADRDLTSRGVTVDLCGRPARMAAGPAALALRTGLPLLPVTIRYESRPRGRWRIVVTIHDEVPVPAGGSPAERARAMTQVCADRLTEAVTAHTEDWHMIQRVFVDDVPPAAGAPPPEAAAGGGAR